jgi:hypothetical protein
MGANIGAITKENYVNGTSNLTIDHYSNTLQESEVHLTNSFSWHYNTTAEMSFNERFSMRLKNVVGSMSSFITVMVFEPAILGIEYGYYHLTIEQGKKLCDNIIIILYILVGIMALPAVFYLLALIIIIILGIKNWIQRRHHGNTQRTENVQMPKV